MTLPLEKSCVEYDFAIITALDEEFRAACDMLHRGMETHKPTKVRPFFFRKCYLREVTTTFTGLVFQAAGVGRVEAAILLACILKEWRFRIIGVVGIGGGVPQRNPHKRKHLDLGDVVFADVIIDTENRKIIPEGEIDRFKEHVISPKIESLFDHFHKNVLFRQNYVKAMHRIGHNPQVFPKIHVGTVISGNEVLAAPVERTALSERVARSNKFGFPICVEMEGAGIATCAERLGVADRLFMIRGISDYADENKSYDEQWRRVACDNAAFVGTEFIKYFSFSMQGRNGHNSVHGQTP